MCSSNYLKYISTIFLILGAFSACRFFESTKPEATPDDLVETNSTVPFTVKEPDNFETVAIVKTMTDNGDDETVSTFRFAKRGVSRYLEFDSGIAVLTVDSGERFRIDLQNKTFSKLTGNGMQAIPDDIETFLTNEWLYENSNASFEALPNEGNLKRFKVVTENKNSEIVVSFDESLGLITKQQFIEIVGEKPIPKYSFELTKFKKPADAKYFQIPPGFELRK
ncbi:MAG: hypothetical protein ACK5NT_04500 [Pyrinomonadaceae bacterium]